MPKSGHPVELGNPRLIAQRQDEKELLAAPILIQRLEDHSLCTRQAHA